MRRFFAALRLAFPGVLALSLAAPAAHAQPGAPAFADGVRLGATVSRAPGAGGSVGDESAASVEGLVVALDGAAAVWRSGSTAAHVGATLRLAATGFEDDDEGLRRMAPQHLDLHAAVTRGGLEALAGVVLDLGPDLFDLDYDGAAFFNSDTQHALRLGARAVQPAGRVVLHVGAEAFLTRPRTATVPYFGPGGEPVPDSTFEVVSDFGDALNAHVGASYAVGPAEVGLTVQVAQQGRSRYEANGAPAVSDPREVVVGLVPSVSLAAAGGALRLTLAARSTGVWPSEHAVYGLPLVVKNTRAPRLPLSLRVAYRW